MLTVEMQCDLNCEALLRMIERVADKFFDPIQPVAQCVVMDVQDLGGLGKILILLQKRN